MLYSTGTGGGVGLPFPASSTSSSDPVSSSELASALPVMTSVPGEPSYSSLDTTGPVSSTHPSPETSNPGDTYFPTPPSSRLSSSSGNVPSQATTTSAGDSSSSSHSPSLTTSGSSTYDESGVTGEPSIIYPLTTTVTGVDYVTTITSTVVGPPAKCAHDNCLREFIRSSSLVVPFCQGYTIGISTVTTNLPKYVSQCQAKPSRISSACSCLLPTPSLTVTTITSTIVSTLHTTITGPSISVGSSMIHAD